MTDSSLNSQPPQAQPHDPLDDQLYNQSRHALLAADGTPLTREAVIARAADLSLRLVATSSTPDAEAQAASVAYLEGLGATVHYNPVDVAARHGIPTVAALASKAQSLSSAWLAAESNAVFTLRGGYGAADILAAIDWSAIPGHTPLVGFSDVSAVHSAFYAARSKQSSYDPVTIHGPMVGHNKCGYGGYWGDLDAVIGLLTGTVPRYHLAATPLTRAQHAFAGGRAITGPVFGGCLSVLTGLIGTPYFPAKLTDHILFFEDVGEHIHRLVRLLSQWQLSGALDGVQAIVLGQLAGCGQPDQEDADKVCARAFGAIIEERTGLPCVIDAQFGHVHPNYPVIIGREATLSAEGLTYDLSNPLIEPLLA